MISWKKLVATSSRFRQESQDFLQRCSPQALFARWNARAEAEEDDELEEDWEKLDTSDCHGVGQDATWMESEDLSLEAADLSVFSQSEDGEWSREEEQEIFHECSSILLNTPNVGQEEKQLQKCAIIFDVSFVRAPMSHRTILGTTVCDTVQRPAKKSLHVPIFVGTRKTMALVDTGASATFIQFSLAKKLGIWEQYMMT